MLREALEATLAFIRQKRWDEAFSALHRLLDNDPENAQTLQLLAQCHHEVGNEGVAYQLYLAALHNKPDFFEAWGNLGKYFRRRGDNAGMEKCFAECERIRPGDLQMAFNRTEMYLNNGTPEAAEKECRLYLDKHGENSGVMVHLGFALLEQEKFGAGFDAMDAAMDNGGRKHRNFQTLGQTAVWDGTPGKSVAVYGEQGIGDEIMFASCLPDALRKCKRVYLDTNKAHLAPILQRSFPDVIVHYSPTIEVQPWHDEAQIDAMIAIGSLPRLFRRTLEDFTRTVPYLKADPARRSEIRDRLDALGPRKKIGIAWKGGTKETMGVYRMIPLEQWAPILQQTAEFVSLQYTPDAKGEADMASEMLGVNIRHWQATIDDLESLTALIAELDLVISVPQTAVHQAGALGVPCWTLTAARPPWPFGTLRDDMVWYPGAVRQFRQKQHGDWGETLFRVAEALAEVIGEPRPTSIVIPTQQDVMRFMSSKAS